MCGRALAIGEYCAEIAPALWPAERAARAHARAIAAEMHAGFRALRESMPMNLGREAPGMGRSAGALRRHRPHRNDLARDARAVRRGGPFLFGEVFTLADAMYAPVVARFLTYRRSSAPTAAPIATAVRAFPLVAAWYDGGGGGTGSVAVGEIRVARRGLKLLGRRRDAVAAQPGGEARRRR